MKSIVVISDGHIGSTVGLCPKEGVEVVDKGRYMPNKYQLTLLKYWRHFWREFVPENTRGSSEVFLELNGDMIDGVHHKTVNIISSSWEVQESAAVDMILEIKEICPVKFKQTFVVKGTEAHVEAAGQSEERIAKAIGATPNELGEYASYQWWLDVDGLIFQFAHHIGVTSSAAYESSAPMREMVSGLVEAAQWGRQIPDVFVRSHRHRFIEVPIPSVNGRIRSIITPGWQLRTPFTERIDRMRMPHIGGVVFRVEDGRCDVREKIYPLPDPKPLKI
jgi:hypothetical protein